MYPPSQNDPMSFLHLDMLTNTLLDSTKELEEEFDRQLGFIREQENNCLKNLNELLSAGQFVDTLKYCIYQSERELDENEASLLEAEKIIGNYVKAYEDFYPNPKVGPPISHTNTITLLNLLVSADRSVSQCRELKQEVEEFNTAASASYAPCKIINKILEYHTKALKGLETQLNQLESMTQEVNRHYDTIKGNLKINGLSTNCICKMAESLGKYFPKKA